MALEDTLNRFWYEVTLNYLWNIHHTKTMKDISYNTSMYLDLIKFKNNPTVSEVAEEIGVSKSAVTMKVNELVKQGLVKRIQSTEDRRIQYIEVTKEVSEEYQACEKPIETALQRIKEKYPEEEITVFCEILDEFSKCLSERPKEVL